MRICKIWDADYPWDVRVEKVCASLVNAGHTVALVCRNQGRRVRREVIDRVAIRRLPNVPRIFGPLHSLCNFPVFFNPCWVYQIAKAIREFQAEMIFVRDVPFVLPAVLLGKLYRIPVILDMAENYPAMLADLIRHTPMSATARAIRRPSLVRLIERVALAHVDHVIVVVDESRDRLIDMGYPAERITVVNNTPRTMHWSVRLESHRSSTGHGGPCVVYLGNLDGSRGVDLAIMAMARLKEQGIPACLTVVGQGPSRPSLERLAESLEVEDVVTFRGRLPFREVRAVLAGADIGLIPHYSTPAWNTTMPNKLFDYMLWGIPVLVSEVKPVAQIVRSENCGEVFKDKDPEDLARCIHVLGDPHVRKDKGSNGLAAVQKRYNWKHDEEALIKAVEELRMRRV
jgi:glycosyltransferase involved in cell wall biosynthesis